MVDIEGVNEWRLECDSNGPTVFYDSSSMNSGRLDKSDFGVDIQKSEELV